MGDMADLAREQEEYLGLERPGGYDPELYWETQFEGWVEIRAMTTSHLENTLKMLERKNMQDHPSYMALVEEFENR